MKEKIETARWSFHRRNRLKGSVFQMWPTWGATADLQKKEAGVPDNSALRSFADEAKKALPELAKEIDAHNVKINKSQKKWKDSRWDDTQRKINVCDFGTEKQCDALAKEVLAYREKYPERR